MRYGHLSLVGRTKLRVLARVLPVRRADVVPLDRQELALGLARVNNVTVPELTRSKVSQDYALPTADCAQYQIELPYWIVLDCPSSGCGQKIRTKPTVAHLGRTLTVDCPRCGSALSYSLSSETCTFDLSSWLGAALLRPNIHAIELLSKQRTVGKVYVRDVSEDRFEGGEWEKDCVHRMGKKRCCSTCVEEEKEKRKAAANAVNLFDLIKPLLEPPIDLEFTSSMTLPPGEELYPYQWEGVKFLVEHEEALLADQMGIGKSIQAIMACRVLFRKGAITNALILCPASVVTDWERKLWHWSPELKVRKIGGAREQRMMHWNSLAHVYLTTYDRLRQDLSEPAKHDGAQTVGGDEAHDDGYLGADDGQEKRFDLVVLDEVQKIKNRTTGIAAAVRMVEAPHRWGLSGTPLENTADELIAIFEYLKPGLLRRVDKDNPTYIRNKVKPYLLRRELDALPEGKKLKGVHSDIWWGELLPEQQEAYDRALRERKVYLEELGDTVTVQHIFAVITALKLICNLDPVTKQSCKLDFLIDKLGSLAEEDSKALIFSQYPKQTLRHLVPALEQFKPLVYDGSLSEGQRDRIVELFEKDDEHRVLLMSVRAGGLGITLTRANYVFHYDLWWNPAVTSQALGRALRIGQKQMVFETSLLTVGTIEEKIQEKIEEKLGLFKQVVGDLTVTNLKAVLTEDEWFDLFGLKKVRRGAPERRPATGVHETPLEGLTPRDFEERVAALFGRMGYNVTVTQESRDGGVDMYAKRVTTSGTELLAVQCKHYPNGVVGVEPARALYGVMHDRPSVTKGVIVTSGAFSRDCADFARGKRIELFDGAWLRGTLLKYEQN